MKIVCLVCEKEGVHGDVGNPPHGKGWFLASNRIGGYTCSKVCDDVILAHDEQKKAEKEAAKKAAKAAKKGT